MKVIVAGSRSITDYTAVEDAIKKSGYKITCVISGTARGVDKLGEAWAAQNNVAVLRCPADWTTHHKAAGPIRNAEMARLADAAVIVYDGHSRGTAHMMECMDKAKKPYFKVTIEEKKE
jgi:hypothetical protein